MQFVGQSVPSLRQRLCVQKTQCPSSLSFCQQCLFLESLQLLACPLLRKFYHYTAEVNLHHKFAELVANRPHKEISAWLEKEGQQIRDLENKLATMPTAPASSDSTASRSWREIIALDQDQNRVKTLVMTGLQPGFDPGQIWIETGSSIPYPDYDPVMTRVMIGLESPGRNRIETGLYVGFNFRIARVKTMS